MTDCLIFSAAVVALTAVLAGRLRPAPAAPVRPSSDGLVREMLAAIRHRSAELGRREEYRHRLEARQWLELNPHWHQFGPTQACDCGLSEREYHAAKPAGDPAADDRPLCPLAHHGLR